MADGTDFGGIADKGADAQRGSIGRVVCKQERGVRGQRLALECGEWRVALRSSSGGNETMGMSKCERLCTRGKRLSDVSKEQGARLAEDDVAARGGGLQ